MKYIEDLTMNIVFDNPKIKQFYSKHTSIDIERVNLFMVDFMEQFIVTHKSENLDNNTDLILKKLSNMESFFKDSNGGADTYQYHLNSQLNSTKTEIVELMKGVIVDSRLDNASQLVERLQLPLSHTLDAKFDNILNQIKQPVCDLMNQSEHRLTTKLESIHQLTHQNTETTGSINKELVDYINKIKTSSSFKGQFGENKLKMILSNMYPQSQLDQVQLAKTSQTKRSGDFSLTRLNKPRILIENKVYESRKVPEDEVQKFIRDADEQKCHGIMLSQDKEISGKKNFQIDIHKEYVLVYVNNVDYDVLKIQMAIDLVDIVVSKVLPYIIQQRAQSTDNNDGAGDEQFQKIPNELLDNINGEYQDFVKRKEEVYVTLNDFQKRIQTQLNDMKFTYLDQFLSGFFASSHSIQTECSICGRLFKGRFPSKALAKHEPSCKKKHHTPIPSDIPKLE